MLTCSLFLQEPRFYTQESLLWLFVCFIKVDTFYILMGSNEPDPDALRWGLLDLQVCTLTNAGSCGSVTRYEAEPVAQGYVREGYNQPLTGNYADNDAVIAQFYQDELSRVERAEEESHLRRSDNPSRISVASQEWPHHPLQGEAVDISDMEDKNVARTARDDDDDDSDCSVEIEEESWSLDSEVGKRMNQMIPIAVSTYIFFCECSNINSSEEMYLILMLLCCSMCRKSMGSYRQRMSRFLIMNGFFRGMFIVLISNTI